VPHGGFAASKQRFGSRPGRAAGRCRLSWCRPRERRRCFGVEKCLDISNKNKMGRQVNMVWNVWLTHLKHDSCLFLFFVNVIMTVDCMFQWIVVQCLVAGHVAWDEALGFRGGKIVGQTPKDYPTIVLHCQSNFQAFHTWAVHFIGLITFLVGFISSAPNVCCLHSHCWFDSTTKWIFHSSNLSIYPVHGYIYIHIYIPWLLYTGRYTWEKMKEERSKMLWNKITNYGNLQEAVSFEYRRHMPTVSPMWPMCHESGEAWPPFSRPLQRRRERHQLGWGNLSSANAKNLLVVLGGLSHFETRTLRA